jgi:hypothetical protein
MPITILYLTQNKPGVYVWVRELDDGCPMEEMELWCLTSNCGHRIEFDKFIFDNEQQRTMFMLRWIK